MLNNINKSSGSLSGNRGISYSEDDETITIQHKMVDVVKTDSKKQKEA